MALHLFFFCCHKQVNWKLLENCHLKQESLLPSFPFLTVIKVPDGYDSKIYSNRLLSAIHLIA